MWLGLLIGTTSLAGILWLEFTTTWGTALKGLNIRKVENH